MTSIKRIAAWGFLSLCVTFLANCASVYVDPNIVKFNNQLVGSNEVPANNSVGRGAIEATLNKTTHELTWRITYSGLTGPVRAGHFHGPAMMGANTGVALGFKGNLDSPIQGAATLTADQVRDVLTSKWYVNLHTQLHPGGEVRAQLIPTN
jgi:hypothetical protein